MKNWPWYGYLVIALLVFALAFFLYFKPRNEELQVLKAERIKVENEVRDLREKKKELDKIEAELALMTAQLKELEQYIPLRKEIAEILRQIQQFAYDCRLDVVRFAPQGELTREFYAEWPIPIQVTGNYHNLGTFFDRLSHYKRLFTIERFNLKGMAKQTDLTSITANWTVKTYFFLEEPKAPAPTKKPARAK